MPRPDDQDHQPVDQPGVEALIERSSLGSTVARKLRARTSGAEATAAIKSTSPSSDDLEKLVAAANDGDRSARNRVLATIRPLVVRYCRARLGRHERSSVSADDVAQEVCLAVLTALPGYRDQGRPFLAFVYGIAAHKVVDAHRSVARSRSEPVSELPEELDPRDGPEQRALDGALSAQMGELLETLPAKQREILVLRVVVGLSIDETAEAVEATPDAVRVTQGQALATLRKTVSEAQDSSSLLPDQDLHRVAAGERKLWLMLAS